MPIRTRANQSSSSSLLISDIDNQHKKKRMDGLEMSNESVSDPGFINPISQNIPDHSTSQGESFTVLQDNSKQTRLGDGNGQPKSRRGNSLHLLPKHKSVISNFIRNKNGSESIPCSNEWLQELFLELSKEDTRVSFEDVLRWYKKHPWIVQLCKELNQSQNVALNPPIAKQGSTGHTNDLAAIYSLKNEVYSFRDSFLECNPSIDFGQTFPKIIECINKMEGLFYNSTSQDRCKTAVSEPEPTSTRTNGQSQGQKQTIPNLKVERRDEEDIKIVFETANIDY